MVREGVLGPAASGVFIANQAHHVHINAEGIERLSNEMLTQMQSGKLQIPDPGGDGIHPCKDHPRAADWVFVTDALNFCFWSSSQDKWTVDGHTGYFALEAALHRAIKEGKDIINPEFYSKITDEDLNLIMRGDNEVQIPLLDKRKSVLHEVGTILLEKYNGTFENCIKEAEKSSERLLRIVGENFPCFRDEAYYKGIKVSLYKRAQILVADLWSFFDRQGWGEFHDIDKMTMFADYRVPQVLLHYGVLSYDDQLMEKLKNDILLESGSEEEVEIRGCSIHAVEMLKERIAQKIASTHSSKGLEVPNSILIDYYLWCYRRKHAQELDSVPFHKTLGIFY